MAGFPEDMNREERIDIHGTQLRLAADTLAYEADRLSIDTRFSIIMAEDLLLSILEAKQRLQGSELGVDTSQRGFPTQDR